jgi:hypothetical protein
MSTEAKSGRLLRFSEVRRVALAACAEFGIKANRVSPKFLEEIEERVEKFVKQQAVASVDDARKTVRGGGA